MLATHSGIYDILLMQLIFLALLGVLIFGRAVHVFCQSGLGPRVVALGLLAIVPIPVGAWAATDARFRNRCVEHHSDIPLCDEGRELPDRSSSTVPAPIGEGASCPHARLSPSSTSTGFAAVTTGRSSIC